MTEMYRNILLPVDGSQQSIDAFKRGVSIAKGWKSEVYLVRVFKDMNDGLTEEERDSLLVSLEDYANKNGVSLQREVVYGDPRSQIADELVKRWNIDLIVMGATGKGRIAKMVIGSITEYVIRHANCDVLISRS